MKRTAASFAFFVLASTLLASAAGGSLTVKASSLSFKQALAACPNALGSVSFTLGHSRVATASGVSADVDTNASGVDTVTFSGNGKSATVVANGHDMTVSGKNVSAKANGQVACVMPE